MKICFISMNLFIHGGIQRVVPNVINEVADKNEITILMPYKDSDKNIFGISEKIKIKNLNDFPKYNKHTIFGAMAICVWKLNKKFGFLNNEIGCAISSKIMFSNKQKKALISYINENDYDVVISITEYYSLLLAMIAPYIDARTIGWQHNTYESYFQMKGRNSYGLEVLFKRMMKNLNHLIVLTDADNKKFNDSFGVHTSTLYNPVSFEPSDSVPEQSNDLIFVGRIYQYQKGIDYLVEIIGKIKLVKSNVHIVVVGDGVDRQRMEECVKAQNLQDNIEFVGMSSDVAEYYKKASIFLHTSRYEGFGVVIIEAMSFGIPVVAFHNNGPDEIITNGVNGILIDQYDTTAYAAKVIELMDNPVKYREISMNAAKRAADFTPKTISAKFEKIIDEVVGS